MSKLAKAVTASIIALALSVPSIAAAEADAEIKGASKKVSYADLDLNKEEGAAVLYKRLKIAARQVCGARTITLKGSPREVREKKACYRETLDAAVIQVNNQYVNKLHTS